MANMTPEQVRCTDELVKMIQQEVTVACQIPITIPKQEILRIIDRAKKWFYKNYEYSVQEKYYAVDATAFSTTLKEAEKFSCRKMYLL